MDVDGKVKARTQDVLPQQAILLGLLDGDLEMVHGQRVLHADVDKALVCTDGVGPNDHPFQNSVGIALYQTAVLIRSWVPFVGVADHVLDLPVGAETGFPLPAGGEARPTPAPQTGALDGLNDLLRGHLKQRLGRSLVAIEGDIVLDSGRVNQAVLPHQDTLLPLVKGYLRLADDLLPCQRVLV